MAIASTMVWEVRPTATAGNANGGGFKPGASGTDFSQQDAAQYNLTGVTTAAADAILLHASAAADMVGNIANITGGTNFTVGRYEIISIVAGVSITLDRNCTTAAGSAGVVNIGGALNFGTADDAVFESMTAGNTMYIKAGTYIMTALSVAAAGSGVSPITISGYNTTRGDNPAFGNQPVLAFGANTATFTSYYMISNLTITTTAASGLAAGTGSLIQNCKSTNSSGTVNRDAFRTSTSGCDGYRIIDCEAVSTNGYCFLNTGNNSEGVKVLRNYFHDSSVGYNSGSGNSVPIIENNIFDTVTYPIRLNSNDGHAYVNGNTLYGAETPTGTGIQLYATTPVGVVITNNIIYGFTTGINSAAVVGTNYYNHNNIYNCTTPLVNVTAGPNDVSINPQFTDAANGNFSIGVNLKALGSPGAFPAGLTTSYVDIGAAQRQEPAGGSGSITVDNLTNIIMSPFQSVSY